MAASRKLIYHRVGEGGSKSGSDCRSIQELLVAAGATDPNISSGGWGPACVKALNAAQERHGRPERSYVEPDDKILIDLCKDADILIPINGLASFNGITTLHEYLVKQNVTYEPGADKGTGTKSFWGLDFDGKKEYIIQRDKAWKKGPILLNCTTYANIMLSVMLQGHVHGSPYDGDCGSYGATSANHMARERYKYTLVTRKNDGKTENHFKTWEQIWDAQNLGTLYHLEVGGGSAGGVSHMVISFDFKVYECTTGQSGSACIWRTLDDFMSTKKSKIIYMFVQPGG